MLATSLPPRRRGDLISRRRPENLGSLVRGDMVFFLLQSRRSPLVRARRPGHSLAATAHFMERDMQAMVIGGFTSLTTKVRGCKNNPYLAHDG